MPIRLLLVFVWVLLVLFVCSVFDWLVWRVLLLVVLPKKSWKVFLVSFWNMFQNFRILFIG